MLSTFCLSSLLQPLSWKQTLLETGAVEKNAEIEPGSTLRSCVHVRLKNVQSLELVSMSNLLKIVAVRFLARGFMCSNFELKEIHRTIKPPLYFLLIGEESWVPLYIHIYSFFTGYQSGLTVGEQSF